MTDKTISPLRRRMTEDMTVRGFTAGTQGGYLAAVENFTAFFGRSPDQASAEDLRRYQLHMRSIGASATTMNSAVSALRFFFGVTLSRGDAQVTGRIDDAKMQAAEVFRINPRFDLSRAPSFYLTANPDFLERFVDGLRMAGLTE